MNKLYIVMPAYNEEKVITKVVEEWHAVVDAVGDGSQLIVCNDGSRDDTLNLLEKMAGRYPHLTVMNKIHTGHGPTCLFAYQYAVDQGADWIFQTDSDGQTCSDDFWSFWEQRPWYDFIIGWRGRRADGLSKWVVSRLLKWALFWIFGILVKDANAPFRLMKAERLRIYLPLLPRDYFLPNVLISIWIVKNKEKVLWKEISFAPRKSGISSMPLKRVIRLGWYLIRQLYKMKNLDVRNDNRPR